MSEITENLKRIKDVATKLNELADEATQSIRRIEQALQSTNVGISYMTPDLNEGDNESEWLGWMRHKGDFRLMHQSSDTGSEWRPLEATSREVRLRIVLKLPTFVQALAKHVDLHAANAEEWMGRARETSGELAEALKLYSPPPPPKTPSAEDRVRPRSGE